MGWENSHPIYVTPLLSFYGFYALHTLIKVAAKPP